MADDVPFDYDGPDYVPFNSVQDAEAMDQFALLRERRLLEIDEHRKFVAGKAFYETRIEFARLREANRLQRARDRKRLVQAQRMLAMAETQRDKAVTERHEAELRSAELLDHVVKQDERLVTALSSEYSSKQLQEAAEQVVQDNPGLRCPACQEDKPLRVFNGSQFCRSCGWKQGEPVPDPSFDTQNFC